MGEVEAKFLEEMTHNDGMAGEGLFAILAMFFVVFTIMLILLQII
jgi:hypothetical protein